MTKYSIPVSQQFREVFGFAANNITPRAAGVGLNGNFIYNTKDEDLIDPQELTRGNKQGYDFEVFEPQEAIRIADTGAAIFDLVTFKHPDLEGGELDMDMLFMIDLSGSKNIKTTIVNENEEGGLPQGEVVESYGWNPWDIRFRGILVDHENHQYPTEKVRLLKKLTDIHDTIQVYSEFLQAMDIENIYFTERPRILRDTSYIDSQPFTLTAKSHAPLEALIIT